MWYETKTGLNSYKEVLTRKLEQGKAIKNVMS